MAKKIRYSATEVRRMVEQEIRFLTRSGKMDTKTIPVLELALKQMELDGMALDGLRKIATKVIDGVAVIALDGRTEPDRKWATQIISTAHGELKELVETVEGSANA